MSNKWQRSGLVRDVELLRALATAGGDGRGAGVTTVAEMTAREPSQVSRGLRALADEGMVERDPSTRAYRLGWRLFALVAGTWEVRLLEAARAPMAALVEELNETVHLCVLHDTRVVTLQSHSAAHGFRATGWTQATVPAHCTSAGRVLLLDHPRRSVERRFARCHDVDVAALYDTVSELRAQRYACVDEEFEIGLVGASAPVRSSTGHVVAALNVSAPKHRLAAILDDAGRRTAKAADQLSHSMGWVPETLTGSMPT